MKTTNLLALGSLLSAGMLFNGTASAQCSGTFADFVQGFTCVDQDKIWSEFSYTSFLDDFTYVINTQTVAGEDRHTMNVLPTNGTISGTLQYAIEVDLNIAPDFLINTVDLSSGVLTGPVTTTKDVWSDGFDGTPLGTLTSVDGLEPATINVNIVKLWVRDTVTVGSPDAQWTNLSNTYTQFNNEVPAPATLALFGMGLLAAGAIRRRRTI